ncbi:pilus assembly protein TadG-related protein [Streptomyces sp. NPDC057386]|uniref:pilus assembly protein TadG-related protein n=1 Tax=unclassified Streptomyces TaxID=2593676 RepID=UPI0036427BAC
MTKLRAVDDRGQAFPIYLTVVGGLLLLAFAYLAVGQAAANRNGAQTAADAAALAAAIDARDQLAGQWVKDVQDPTRWQDIFDGNAAIAPSCWRAYELAGRNEAHVEQCAPTGLLGYTVEVKTDRPVGDSVVPGTESKYATASATAVIEPLCTFDMPAEESEEDVHILPSLKCKHRTWELTAYDPAELPKPQDLFDVHLADD